MLEQKLAELQAQLKHIGECVKPNFVSPEMRAYFIGRGETIAETYNFLRALQAQTAGNIAVKVELT